MSASASGNGELFLVATPIGNLDDLSSRARTVLAEVDLIAAEDTRHTGRLLAHLGIECPLLSLHEHNERARTEAILRRLEAGSRVALVADAGTPLISDPGYELVRAAGQRGIRVVPVPGPCAAIVALTVSGLRTDRFVFEGFLPSRQEARRARLKLLQSEQRSLVFYEAPHRLAAVLGDLAGVLVAEREACVARELTKRFETLYRGTLVALARAVEADTDMQRGEVVIVVAGAPAEIPALPAEAERIVQILASELAPSQAARLAARITGVRRASLYEIASRAVADPRP